MRKLFLLPIIFMSLLFTSCEDVLTADEVDHIVALRIAELQQTLLARIDYLNEQVEALRSGIFLNKEALARAEEALKIIKTELASSTQEIATLRSLSNNMRYLIYEVMDQIQDEHEEIYDYLDEILDKLYDIEQRMGNNTPAQNSALLQAQINALLEQLASLQIDVMDIGFNVYNIEVGNGDQLFMYYEGLVNYRAIQFDRVDIYFEMDEYPWETYESIRLVKTDGGTIVLTNLNNENNWEDLGSEVYRIRINMSDIVEAGEKIEHNLYAQLQTNAEDDDVETYVDVRYTRADGTVSSFQTVSAVYQIED